MNILILQHIAIEDPGYLKQLMIKDGWRLNTVQLDEGETIPSNLAEFDAMICMGGPMDTWMEQDYPWLIAEKKAIHTFVVELNKPFLGFCLGAQLLGEVLGGKVIQSTPPEIGVLTVKLTTAANNDVLFHNLPSSIQTVQWHSYEVSGLNNNNQVRKLAYSPTTAYQAFTYQNYAYGIQFHIEVEDHTISEWGKIPAYKNALINTLGEGALVSFEAQTKQHIKTMNQHCQLLYHNFKKLLKQHYTTS